MRTTAAGAVILALLISYLAVPASAEDTGPGTADRASSLRSEGRYGDAEDLLEKALSGDTAPLPELREYLELLLDTGRYEKVGEAATRGGEDAGCRTMAAESLLARGRHAEALEVLDGVLAAAPASERARYARGLVLREMGEREKARDAFKWFFDYYAKNDVTDPAALTCVAAATVRYAELSPDISLNFAPTMKLLDAITRDHPTYLPAYVEKGDLYLAVYQDQDALKGYRKALERNGRYAPALHGLAKQMDFRFNQFGAAERCREALLTNPNLFMAKEYLARTLINDSQYGEARKIIDEILAVNPKRKPARALLAVMDFCTGHRKLFEKRAEELLAEDPRYAGVYVELVRVLEQQRRFREAAIWAEKGAATDPEDWMAWWMRGRNLVHMGREAEAVEALKKSRALDPFAQYDGNPFRENMIEVLGRIEEFVETRTENFIYKIHVGENDVLLRYYQRFLEKSWRLLTKKYDFTPEGPILTEVFHIHADFAARTIGLPGIGALGACFGKVMTLDSPSARRPGEFTWASTAHHEFAHVMTLQLSKGRVPRWFTEGLSVYEERQYADWWERDMDRRLYDRYKNGELYEILKFNRAFRGRDVLFAYYLGGMMIEFMEGEFGWPKILEMLKAYGEDRQTPVVLRNVLGVEPAEYDERFRKWVGNYVGNWKMVPRWSGKTVAKMDSRLTDDPKDLDALLTLAWANFQHGQAVDAMSSLGRAIAIAPDDKRAILLRAEIAFRNGRFDKAGEWYEKFFEAGGDDLMARLHHAKLLEGKREFEAAVAQYEASKACFPYYAGPGNAFAELARLKKGEGDLEGAMREFEKLALLQNTNIDIRLELADYYENAGDSKRLIEILDQIVLIYPLGEKLAMPVHARLAAALADKGRHEDAELEYEVAIELGVPKEKEPEIRVALGEVQLLLGKPDEARFQASCVLELDPTNEQAKELLRKASE